MSRRKDRERAKYFVYRGGQCIPRAAWDSNQRKLRELAEEQRLKAMGLSSARPKIAVAERVGLQKARKQLLTLDELRRYYD